MCVRLNVAMFVDRLAAGSAIMLALDVAAPALLVVLQVVLMDV